MDDQRTNQTLDALGDLCLTGSGPVPAADNASASLADQLEGPRPFRISTQQRPSSIFDSDDDEHIARRAINNSAIQGVFLGNLPGFGGPWLTQYAHELAKQVGPVAVLHVDHEQIDLELVGAAEHRKQIDQLAAAGNVPASEGLIAALSAITRPNLPTLGAYLVHLPMPLNETSLTIAPDLPQWTMISSSDQASIVAALRWVSELAGFPDVDDQPAIGLMVMGVDEDEARESLKKLNDAASGLVHQPIELIGSLRQMVPVQMKTLGSFEAGPGLWPRLAAFLDAQPQPQLQPQVDKTTAESFDEPALKLTNDLNDQPQDDEPVEVAEIAPEESEQVAVQSPQPSSSPPPESQPLPPVELQPEPDSEPQQEDQAEPFEATEASSSVRAFVDRIKGKSTADSQVFIEDDRSAEQSSTLVSPLPAVSETDDISETTYQQTDEPNLAVLIGIEPMAAQCPRHEQVQLALETNGRLNLLLEHEDPAAAMAILSQVRSWASQHAKLLQLSSPQHTIDFQAPASLRIFTADAKADAAMVAHVDPHIHLHLLQTVTVAGQSSWFTTELN